MKFKPGTRMQLGVSAADKGENMPTQAAFQPGVVECCGGRGCMRVLCQEFEHKITSWNSWRKPDHQVQCVNMLRSCSSLVFKEIKVIR